MCLRFEQDKATTHTSRATQNCLDKHNQHPDSNPVTYSELYILFAFLKNSSEMMQKIYLLIKQ